MPTLTETAVALLERGEREANAVFRNQDNTLHHQRIRLGKHSDYGALIMSFGRKRYGTPVSHYRDLLEIHPIARRQSDPAIKWRKQIERAIFMLEGSRLWPEILAELKLGLEIGLETLQKVYKIESGYRDGEDYEAGHARKTAEVKAICPKLIRKNEKGKEYVATDLIWHWLHPRIRTMYFGKDFNQWRLAEIAKALKEKRALHIHATAGYDVGFEYNPDLNKAWYSEEFRNCGNGHYYLALNGTHCIFYEDD